MLAEIEVEAFKTLVLVVEMFVLAVASELPKDVEAFVILVLAVFTLVPIVDSVAPSEVDAFVTAVLTAVMLVFAVLIFVLAVASELPRDVEAKSV